MITPETQNLNSNHSLRTTMQQAQQLSIIFGISSTVAKERTAWWSKRNSSIEKFSFEWLHKRISPKDWKVKNPLLSIINRNKGKFSWTLHIKLKNKHFCDQYLTQTLKKKLKKFFSSFNERSCTKGFQLENSKPLQTNKKHNAEKNFNGNTQGFHHKDKKKVLNYLAQHNKAQQECNAQ